jgi:outer membrane protein assembly factor BamB
VITVPRQWIPVWLQKKALVAAVCVVSVAAGADWPQWRGPRRNGISTETDWSCAWLEKGPPELWRVNLGRGFSSVSISENRLYTVGKEGAGKQQTTVHCLDAASGKTLWKHTFACGDTRTGIMFPGPRATPTVDGDAVYVHSQQGDLLCLDKTSGKLRWSKDFKTEFDFKPISYESASSPLICGDLLIVDVCAEKANIAAFNKNTGAVVWSTTAGQKANLLQVGSYSSPVAVQLGDQPAVLSFVAAGLVALRPQDGKTLWAFDFNAAGDRNVNTPLVEGDKVFISNGDPYVRARGCALVKMEADKATALWRNTEMKSQWSTAVLWKGYLYGYDGKEYADQASMVCLDWNTGAVRWRQTTKKSGSLLCAGGKLIALSFDGELSIVDADPGAYRQLASCRLFQIDPEQFKAFTGVEEGNVASPDICRTPPVLSGGRLYCRNAGGELVCLDLRKVP